MASARVKLFAIGVGFVAVVAGLWLIAANRPSDDPGSVVEVSGPMPELAGPTLDGSSLTPEAYDGMPVVVNFWASWCGPCREEQPHLQSLSQEYEGRVAFVGVNFRDDPAAAREYLREYSVTYPSVEDPAGQVAFRFGVPYLPATVLVDATGQMRYRMLGAQTEQRLREYLGELTSL